MSLLSATLSPDESLLAVLPSTTTTNNNSRFLSIPIYQVASKELQCTLTCPKSSPDEYIVGDAAFCSSAYCCVLLSSNRVVVWNVTRGVLQHTIQVDESTYQTQSIQTSSSTSSTTTTLSLFVTSQENKTYVLLYNVESGKCIRKIKCGKNSQAVAAAVFQEKVVALLVVNDNHKKKKKKKKKHHTAEIKLVSLQDGSKLNKFKTMHGNKDSILEFSSNGNLLAVASKTSIEIINVQGDKDAITTTTIQAADHVTKMEFVVSNKDTEEYMLLVETANTQQAYLYQVKSDSNDVATTLASSLSCEDTAKSCRYFMLSETLLVAATIVTNGKEETVLREFNYMDDNGNVISQLGVELSAASSNESEMNKKRKAAAPVQVLGPGQAGMETQALMADGEPQAKRKKPNEEEEEEEVEEEKEDETIAERLERLTQEMLEEEEEDDDDVAVNNEFDFNVKKATTESLSKLLQQALTSGDDAMLELALQVRNTKVMEQTISELESSHVETLLQKLTFKFASKPTRAQDLSTWLQLILCSKGGGASVKMQSLRPLRNLLQERVESFPHLLQLQGRLSLMGGGYSK